ncbi:MAG: hypothetical protein VX661_12580 [Pseudomonadota bacterium]|jgi:hypothetical protein|nr:hypothetical protein [Pseudomonadota bacterium]
MRGLIAWLNEHWPETVSALAAVATLIVVLRDRWKAPDFPINAELTVHLDRESGDLSARLTFLRPETGFLSFPKLRASGWQLSRLFTKPDGYGSMIDDGNRLWQDAISFPQEYGRPRRSAGHSDLATLEFWVRRRTSSNASNVMRLKLIARWRSERTLRKTIKIESNAID